jgi:CRP/FNR family transcriptional regulator, cyclic AMP receptor protein
VTTANLTASRRDGTDVVIAPRSPTGTNATLDAVSILRASRLFTVMPSDFLAQMEQYGEVRTYRAGEVSQLGWGADAAVHFVLRGAFRVSRMTANGRFVSIRAALTGDHFGEIEVFTREPLALNTIHCDQSGACYVLPGSKFCALLAGSPQLAEEVVREISAEANRRAERIYEFITLDVRSRLLAELSRLAEAGRIDGMGARIEPAPTHDMLATQVGSSREGVTRHLQDFVRRGLMKVPRRGVIDIIDRAALRAALAKESGEYETAPSLAGAGW